MTASVNVAETVTGMSVAVTTFLSIPTNASTTPPIILPLLFSTTVIRKHSTGKRASLVVLAVVFVTLVVLAIVINIGIRNITLLILAAAITSEKGCYEYHALLLVSRSL